MSADQYTTHICLYIGDVDGYSGCFSWFSTFDGRYIVTAYTQFGHRGIGVVDDFGTIVEVKP